MVLFRIFGFAKRALAVKGVRAEPPRVHIGYVSRAIVSAATCMGMSAAAIGMRRGYVAAYATANVRGYSTGPSKPKSLLAKAKRGRYLCRFCKPSLEKPSNNDPYSFNGPDALKEHIIAEHPEILNDKSFSACRICGNYWQKGEPILCDFLGERPRLAKIPKLVIRATAIDLWALDKKEKYSFDDDETDCPPDSVVVPAWIQKITDPLKETWMGESVKDNVYMYGDTYEFLMCKVGLLDEYYMEKHGKLDERKVGILRYAVIRSGVAAALVKTMEETDYPAAIKGKAKEEDDSDSGAT